MNADSRRAVILGCATGIGAEGARILAQEGWRLALLDVAADALADLSGALDAQHFVVDAADPEQLSQTLGEAIAALGGVDAVWSNVGVQTAGTVEQASVADLDRCYSLNVRSHFVVSQRAVPALRANGGGALLLTASNAGLTPDTGFVAYSATKAATVALAKLLALDHAGDGIRVNALCPGWVDTPFNSPIWEKFGGREKFLEEVPSLVPITRIATGAEMARIACRLLSDEFSFMTGHALVVDGGELLL